MSLIDSDTVTANLVSRTEVREMRGRYTRLSRVSPAFACFERALNVFVSKIWMISLLTLFERERERENNARVETLNLIGQQFRRSIDRKLSYEFVLVIDERSRCSRTFLFISRKRIESYKYNTARPILGSDQTVPRCIHGLTHEFIVPFHYRLSARELTNVANVSAFFP